MDTYYDPHNDLDRDIHNSQSSESSISSANSQESREEVITLFFVFMRMKTDSLACGAYSSESTKMSRTKVGVCSVIGGKITRV